jgi:hypothetical protein
MIRKLLLLLTASAPMLAAFPVELNQAIPSVPEFVNGPAWALSLDVTRPERVVASMRFPYEHAFYIFDQENNTASFSKQAFLSSTGELRGPQIIATPTGSKWIYTHVSQFAVPQPLFLQTYLSFDHQGTLTQQQSGVILADTKFVHNESGLFGIGRNAIRTLEGFGESTDFDPCLEFNGSVISPCIGDIYTAIGVGNHFWMVRYVGTDYALQLVQYSVGGRVMQVQNLPRSAVAESGSSRLWHSRGLLRLNVYGANTISLVNIAIEPDFRIQRAAQLSIEALRDVLPLGSQDWLLQREQSVAHVSLPAFDNQPRSLVENYRFATLSNQMIRFESNPQGDVLSSVQSESRTHHQWRDARGNLLLDRQDLIQAKLPASGNLFAVMSDGKAGLLTQRFGRDAQPLGNAESFSDAVIAPISAKLYRGANSELLTLSRYWAGVRSPVNRIDLSGSRESAGTIAQPLLDSVLHDPGSAWLHQLIGSNQLESLNAVTSQRFFSTGAIRVYAVGDALYRLSLINGSVRLEITRDGQSGSVSLPESTGYILSATRVNPALATQDEFRFVLRTQVSAPQLGRTLVFGVANGQVAQRFEITHADSSSMILLNDGGVLLNPDQLMTKKYTNTGMLLAPFQHCGEPIGDARGGIWSRRKIVPEEEYFIVCHTSHDGIFSESRTLIERGYGVRFIAEDGDLVEIDSNLQTRFHVMDGVVRHYSSIQQFFRGPLARDASVHNIGAHIYGITRGLYQSPSGLKNFVTRVEQTNLMGTAELIDRFTRSGFE